MKFFTRHLPAVIIMFATFMYVSSILAPAAAALPGNRSLRHGYFTNKTYQNCSGPSNCGAVLSNGIPSSARTKSSFVSYIRGLHNAGGSDGIGADFIIQLMRGGTDHSRASTADVNEWAALVNQSSVTTRVLTTSYDGYNSARTKNQGTTDEIFFAENGSASSLVFYQNGRVVFKIKLACGNPLGDLAGLTKDNTPARGGIQSVTCTYMRGWAYDPDHGANGGSAAVYVRLYVNGVYKAYVRASHPNGSYNDGYIFNISSYITQNINDTSLQLGITVRDIDTGAYSSLVSTTYNAKANCGNSEPTGSFVGVTCTPSTAAQSVRVSFGDADGSGGKSYAYIKVGSWQSPTTPAGNSYTFSIDKANYDNLNSQVITLYVLDIDPNAANAYQAVATTSTRVPCYDIDCGSFTVTPGNIDPYTKFNITVSATNNSGSSLPSDKFTLNVSGPGFTYGPATQPATGSGSTASAAFTNLGPTGSAGVYQVSWTYVAGPGAGYTINCGYPLDTSAQFDVRYEPYVSVYGGDAMAGASPQIDTTGDPAGCYTNTDAGFTSWNQGSAGNYAGAGAEIAVMALKDINNFASDLPDNPPTYLSFANSATNPVGGDYGGDFGGSVTSCDYTSGMDAPVTLGNWNSTAFTVPAGPLYAHVKGDIVISGNIVYSSTGSWASIADMPYLRLVVDGNIFIDHSVTELDGVYVAVASTDGSATTGGNIYTCTNGADLYALDDAAYYDDCKNQLKIYGSFVAKNISFQRTYGSLGQAASGDAYSSSKAGEVFIYTPELWIPRPNTGSPNAIDSISGAAPTL